jgi:polysaccharide biosynthesis/export protein
MSGIAKGDLNRSVAGWGAAPGKPLRSEPGTSAAQRRLAVLAALVSAVLMLCVPVRVAFAQGSSAAAAEYRLGSGDVIRISVFQNPELTLETRVTEGGLISFPLLGSIKLGGLGVTQAEALIADGLRKGNFVRSPQVTLSVLQVRGNQASVLGQVNRPGRFPIEVADMRLSDLLAMAGGSNSVAADLVVLTGTRDNKPYRIEVDLPTLFTSAGRAQDVLIMNGDTVWVDRQPTVYIYGEVQRPGPMRLERDMTLMQVLATGGGLNSRGTEKGIRVHRTAANGTTEVIQAKMDDRLRHGDVVFVRESLF